MRSAWRTVEKRCEIRIVVQCRVAARMRSKISASPRTSSCAVGSSSSTTPAPSLHGGQRAGQRDALPLAAGKVGAARRSRGRARCRARPGSPRRPPRARRAPRHRGAPAGRHVVAQRQLEADEILKHGGRPRAPGGEIELAQVDAVDFDRAGLRVVQAGTAAWRAWSCPRRSGRRWRATSRRES